MHFLIGYIILWMFYDMFMENVLEFTVYPPFHIFLIGVAFVLFMVKLYFNFNTKKSSEESTPPEPTKKENNAPKHTFKIEKDGTVTMIK